MRHCGSGLKYGCLLVVAALVVPVFARAEDAPLALETLRVRVLLGRSQAFELRSAAPIMVRSERGSKELPAGAYTVGAESVTAPGQRYHLFIKTFAPAEESAAREFMAEWKGRGYAPEEIMFGKRFETPAGAIIDNRRRWISVARFDSERQAEALKSHLQTQSVWGWIVTETVGRGAATVTIDGGGRRLAHGAAPLTFSSAAPLEAPNIDRGFWNPRHTTMGFGGTLEVAPGPDGALELVELIPVEDYIAGVLPAEMPASWPAEALKAQAAAARTEIFAALGGKHMLDGFDFCATEHCRAYAAHSGRQPSTDLAVAETRGVVMTRAGRFVSAVFSANCGGSTENNDAVWSGPADAALRSRSDVRSGNKTTWRGGGINSWLKQPPPAWCDHRTDNYRWTRRFTAKELSDIVNKRHRVGTIRSIEQLERAPGGRLTGVRITGTGGTAVVQKELNIRLAFGGLPSAKFIVETSGGAGAPSAFTFVGGGRGHGVGLCQDGACGMARAGKSSAEILRHYFSDVDVIRLQ